MEPVVSKLRTKKTKSREKKAVKASAGRPPLREHSLVGLLIAVLLWASCLLLLRLEQFIRVESDSGFLQSLIADGIFLLISLFASGLFLKLLKPEILRQNSRILLLALISLSSLLPAKLLLYAGDTVKLLEPEVMKFFLPVVIAPLLGTILLGAPAGVAVGVWTTCVVVMLADRSFSLLLTGLVATVVAADGAAMVRTRSKVVRIGVIAGLSEISCVFALTALNWKDAAILPVVDQAAACLGSGFLSGVLVLLILPFFETVFRITTDITLLELSDLGHPLLQKLAIEAPGTYHHSLVVANLAQAAADEIGANSLQARVCSYFHDIGKLTKPRFFSENILHHDNPHDDLLPSMSALVITAHVKEGLSLAVLHKLPDPVVSVIREHHGTSLLSYFHHKAKSQLELEPANGSGNASDGSNRVSEIGFRYGGPKPSTRESAIIALADPVEAASRSMEKTTPGHIEGLVNEIVTARVLDGQLEQCDLAMSDLTRVKTSFVFTLTNVLHGRIPYPKDEDRDRQQANGVSGRRFENKEPGTAFDG